MAKFRKEDALEYHAQGRPGKIEVIPTKPYSTQRDLTLAYSPGVAEPCLEIEKNPEDAYKYTSKGNLVAVISNGTAVLGLGDIGALASKPVMEGKGLLFKIFADIDVFDIEVDTKNIDAFVQTVKNIAPTFGGINLEDIKAPECFEIERRLKEVLDIPLMHDDQHGTAIISAAGLLNAVELSGKQMKNIRLVINGAGASANSCAKMYLAVGVKKENIIMLDSKGVIHEGRNDLDEYKRFFARPKKDLETLEDAIKGADVFVGLSKGNILSSDMVRKMNKNCIVFALANPTPEISYEEAVAARKDIIVATGRSDNPNQVNNVLGFPFIFRGAMDVRATTINEAMKLAATKAIAQLAKEPVPDYVNLAYGSANLAFGKNYIIPKPIDNRLIVEVSSAVAKAAVEQDELRLFYAAISRASEDLIITAVDSEEEQPSNYFDFGYEFAHKSGDEKSDGELERTTYKLTEQLSVANVVAKLRRELMEVGSKAAAETLKALAEVGITGADPDYWYGLKQISSSAPAIPENDLIRVSPSGVEKFDECELRWFLETHGGQDGNSTAQLIGTVIHKFAELAEKEDKDFEAQSELLKENWRLVDPETGWISKTSMGRALLMLERFYKYRQSIAGSRTFKEAEAKYEFTIGRAHVRCSIDRIETTCDGKIYIIDFKTGKSRISIPDAQTDAQMQIYQYVVGKDGAEVAGASLVYLDHELKGNKTRDQLPINRAEVAARIEKTAVLMGGKRYLAVKNNNCQFCSVSASCPIQIEGRGLYE